MFSMKPSGEKFWCEFGCEVRIYYEHIEFSDGLKISIPRSVKTDKIHECPMLTYAGPDPPTFTSEDPEIAKEQLEEQDGHIWDGYEVSHCYEQLNMDLSNVNGLEFKTHRDGVKECIVEFLNVIPEFYEHIPISSGIDGLPNCLRGDTVQEGNDYVDRGLFPPAALLGIFYEMDGSLEDTKKCFEIQMQTSSNIKSDIGSEKDFWHHKLDDINRQIRMNEQKLLIKKQTDRESKKSQTSNQEQDQTLLQDVLLKTHEFERDDFRTYAFSKITKNEMTSILKELRWFPHKNKTLMDKAREMQKKEEYDTILPLDPTDWDYLDLSDKIKILMLCPKCHKVPNMHTREDLKMHEQNTTPNITKTISQNLRDIRRHRNAILAHPKKYKKQDLVRSNKIIMLYIQECQDFFEKSKNA